MKTGQTGGRLCVLCAFYHVVLTPYLIFYFYLKGGINRDISGHIFFFSCHTSFVSVLFFFNIAICDFCQTTKQVEEELAKVVGKE